MLGFTVWSLGGTLAFSESGRGNPQGSFRISPETDCGYLPAEEGRCKATWKREFKLPWREAGPPIHHDDKVVSDQ